MLERTRLPRSSQQQHAARLLCPDPEAAPAAKRARWSDDEVGDALTASLSGGGGGVVVVMWWGGCRSLTAQRNIRNFMEGQARGGGRRRLIGGWHPLALWAVDRPVRRACAIAAIASTCCLKIRPGWGAGAPLLEWAARVQPPSRFRASRCACQFAIEIIVSDRACRALPGTPPAAPAADRRCPTPHSSASFCRSQQPTVWMPSWRRSGTPRPTMTQARRGP